MKPESVLNQYLRELSKPSWVKWIILIAAGGVGAGIIAATAFAAIWLMRQPAPPLPITSGQATPVPTIALVGSISGRVWQDQCSVGTEHGSTPAVPSTGCVPLGDGKYVANGIYEAEERGLSGVQLDLGLGACPSSGLATAEAQTDGSFTFANLPTDTYCVSIGSSAQPSILPLPGRWTFPAGELSQPTGSQTITLGAGENRQDVNFGWDPETTPVPSPVPTDRPTPASTACTNRAAFVKDLNIPDGTSLTPGMSFEKGWRLRNAGTCTWASSYTAVFVSGHDLGSEASQALGVTVFPGEDVDVQVPLKAPMANGTYRSNWMLRNSAGVLFGIGPQAENVFWVQIVVGEGGSAPIGDWRGEYFDNRTLAGSPEVVRKDPLIDFDWGDSSPTSTLSQDNFSVRWTGRAAFEAATYTFKILVDDGARLWVDGLPVIDSWNEGSVREVTADLALTHGTHSVEVEYFEHKGAARIRLSWEKGTASFPDWKGEYFSNRELHGNPALVRNDDAVEFDWGSSAPAVGLPEDSFSIRWTRKVKLEAGVYRLNARADDGIRVFVDGVKVIDRWQASSGKEIYRAEQTLSGKTDIVIEYVEYGGQAKVSFWYERLQPTATTAAPSSTPSSTASVTLTATATATVTDSPSPSPTQTQAPTLTPSPTATELPPSETPTATPTQTPTCVPVECGPDIP